MTTYAHFEEKQAYLSSDFGRDYAMKSFNLTLEQLETLVGRYSKGKRVGQLRGIIRWKVVTRGGWVRSLSGGFAIRPGLRYGHSIVDGWTGKLFLGADWEKMSNAELITSVQGA